MSRRTPSPLRAYRSRALSVRAHVLVRWWSCPFPAVLAELTTVPPSASVLDVGTGHGVLAMALADARPDVAIVGVDIDGDKIEIARQVAPPTVHFEVVDPDAGLSGDRTWDAIVAVDVLYLLPPQEQARLVAQLAATLAPDGRLVVKEMDVVPWRKAAWMRFQERLAVRVLRITKGDSLAFTRPDHLRRSMTDAGLEVSVRRIDRWYPHPHVLLVGRRPAS